MRPIILIVHFLSFVLLCFVFRLSLSLKALRRCAVSETTILDLIDQLQSVPHISDVHEWLLTRLDTALNTAKMENADDEIINRAESLNFTMHAEV